MELCPICNHDYCLPPCCMNGDRDSTPGLYAIRRGIRLKMEEAERIAWDKGYESGRNSTINNPYAKRTPSLCLCLKCTGGRNNPLNLEAFRYACEICGNKRCPHHSDHNLICTDSNEPGQEGSLYVKGILKEISEIGTRDCPMCNGAGARSSAPGIFGTWVCGQCNGTGRISILDLPPRPTTL